MTISFASLVEAGFVLTADSGLFQQMGANFRGQGSGLGGTAAVWGGLLSVFAAVWWMSAIYLRKNGKLDNPRRLFRELCRGQRLSWKEVVLLRELADRRGLDSPLPLFVRQDYFDWDDGEAVDEKIRREAESLRAKLFASADEAAVALVDEAPA